MRKYTIPLLLSTIFILPSITAYLGFQYRETVFTKHTNKGHWVTPSTTLPLETHGKWQLIYAEPHFSLKSLEQLAKIRLALGRRLYQVELKWVNPMTPDTDTRLLKRMDIQPVSMEVPKTLKQETIWLVDPKGQVVLAYGKDHWAQAVYQDMKKLVK